MNSDKIQESESLQRICMPLLAWYEKNSRELEWRQNPLPYYVWVSEIMLQQTRVETVRPYFLRFVKELPDINHLARCSEERLLKLWEGLGYYSRVRNLKKAARIVADTYGGQLPADVRSLRSLPGIGSYTAGAIASIAFSIPEPAVDGNVLRVLSRITASDQCIDEPGVKASFEEWIRAFLESEKERVSPGAFNQALMELGAVVCLPNGSPLCDKCPVCEMCLARNRDLIRSIPVRKQKNKRRIEDKTILVIRDSRRALIRKRPDKGLLAGLWELPNVKGHLTQDQALAEAEKLGVSPVRIRTLPEEKHIFSHVEWHMTGYLILAEEMEPYECRCTVKADGTVRKTDSCLAVSTDRIQEEYSIPTAFARYTAWLNIRRSP